MKRSLVPLFLSIGWLGAQPLPADPPLPDVFPEDVIRTTVLQDGQRKIISQELDPVSMEEKVEALRPLDVPSQTEAGPPDDDLPSGGEEMPQARWALGASVHVEDPAHPERAITYLRLSSASSGEPEVSFWVNANFLWLTWRALEVEAPTVRHSFMLVASPLWEEVPAGLAFPEDGRPTLIAAQGQSTAAQREALEALLALYIQDREGLRANYESRVSEAAAAEAARLADPPEQKDLTIRWWRSGDAARDGVKEGGSR